MLAPCLALEASIWRGNPASSSTPSSQMNGKGWPSRYFSLHAKHALTFAGPRRPIHRGSVSRSYACSCLYSFRRSDEQTFCRAGRMRIRARVRRTQFWGCFVSRFRYLNPTVKFVFTQKRVFTSIFIQNSHARVIFHVEEFRFSSRMRKSVKSFSEILLFARFCKIIFCLCKRK